MAAATRIYLVTLGGTDRLVRATHPSHALMHVARDLAQVRVAGQEELVARVGAGIRVEDIKAEQQELPT